jgi:hypothetical protein
VADLDLSLSQARFSDEDPVGDNIPGALDRVVSGGVTAIGSKASASLRLRHFGPRPLIEDASVMSNSTTLWNAEGGYWLTSHLRLSVDLFNLFDAEVSDIDYYYASRLPDEPAGGIDDIHTHPTLPRTLRIALNVRF